VFLAHLIDRTLEGRSAIVPRRAARFEPEAGVAEPGWLDVEPAPAPPRASAPSPAETHPQAMADQPHAPEQASAIASSTRTPAMDPGAAPFERQAPAQPPSVSSTTIVHRLESLAPPEPPVTGGPISPAVATPAIATPAIHERHTHERVEVRHAPHEIERRLEVLTREHLIERIVRGASAPQSPRDRLAEPAGGAPAQVEAAPLPRSRAAQPAAATISRRQATLALPAAPPPAAPTVVQVSIGRIEVRNAPAPAARSASRAREPRTGLEDYLRRREQG
jgi:hypothetical protein